MPPEIIKYIAEYGYFAIFSLIFLQEIGLPNPIPNELMLIFLGYLAFKGVLSLPILILIALSADFMGTNILYFVFYFLGEYILKHKSRWLPISRKTIGKISKQFTKGGLLKIYFLRLTPFVRGYTSVVAGLLQVKPKFFLPIAFLSALTWSGFYIVIGKMIGSHWSLFEKNIYTIKNAILLIVASALVLFMLRYFIRQRINKNNGERNLHL